MQILHIDGMCNECGNCGTFCPHIGNPYKDKITLFWSMEAFEDSTNKGFLFIDEKNVFVRDEQNDEFRCSINDKRLSKNLSTMIYAVKHKYNYMLI